MIRKKIGIENPIHKRKVKKDERLLMPDALYAKYRDWIASKLGSQDVIRRIFNPL